MSSRSSRRCDNGKPIRESRDVDVPLAAAHFFYYAGWADKLDHAGFGPSPKPLGVAGQIIPWNFPLLMAAWKLAPALAAGNTCVLKPAETTPLSALVLADILQQAELPPGVVNILTGAGSTGAALVAHDGVDKVAFTGSTEVGRRIQESIAGTDKHLTLELGGKAANIVFADAALDQAVEGIVNGIFFNQGHVCCAGSRLLVEESVADDGRRDAEARRLGTLRLGDPMDKNTDIGAINSAEQLERIVALADAGVDEGAERGARRACCPRRGGGSRRRSSPTSRRRIASRARRSSGRCCRSSPSARPTRPSRRRTTPTYGLSAGVWTEKGSRILAMADRLRAGVVWANTSTGSTRQPVRRVQGVGVRPRGRPPRSRGVPRCLSRASR